MSPSHLGCYTYGLAYLPLPQLNISSRRKDRIEVLHKSVHGISSLGAKHSYYVLYQSNLNSVSCLLKLFLTSFKVCKRAEATYSF